MRGLRGQHDDGVRVAAAIEMFHNAFLIHDDIEDESLSRRGIDCLHTQHGIPLADNAGDGLNLLAVDTVLSNIDRLGLARTLGLIPEVIHMCRESTEGQAIELGWIRNRRVPVRDADYVLMAGKKTGWYTCRSPVRLGAIAAGHTRRRELDLLGAVFAQVGIALPDPGRRPEPGRRRSPVRQGTARRSPRREADPDPDPPHAHSRRARAR